MAVWLDRNVSFACQCDCSFVRLPAVQQRCMSERGMLFNKKCIAIPVVFLTVKECDANESHMVSVLVRTFCLWSETSAALESYYCSGYPLMSIRRSLL